jgi:hypothetical protein
MPRKGMIFDTACCQKRCQQEPESDKNLSLESRYFAIFLQLQLVMVGLLFAWDRLSPHYRLLLFERLLLVEKSLLRLKQR